MPSLPKPSAAPKYTQNLQKLLSAPISTQTTSLKYLKPILLILESSDEFCFASGGVSGNGTGTPQQYNGGAKLTRASSAQSLLNSTTHYQQYKKKKKQAIKQLLALWDYLLSRMKMVFPFDEDAQNATLLSNKKEQQKSHSQKLPSKLGHNNSNSLLTNIPPSQIEQNLILQILLCLMKRKEFLSEMKWDEALQRVRLMEHEQAKKMPARSKSSSDVSMEVSSCGETDSEVATTVEFTSAVSTTPTPSSISVSGHSTTTTAAKRKLSTTASPSPSLEKGNHNIQTPPMDTKQNTRKNSFSQSSTTPMENSAPPSNSSPFSNFSSFIRTQFMGKGASSSFSHSSSLSLLKKRSKKQSIISVYANRLYDTLLLALYFLTHFSSPAASSSSSVEKSSSFLSRASQNIPLTSEQERFSACVLGLCCIQIFSKDICTMVIDVVCLVTLRRKPSDHVKASKSRRHQKMRSEEKSKRRRDAGAEIEKNETKNGASGDAVDSQTTSDPTSLDSVATSTQERAADGCDDTGPMASKTPASSNSSNSSSSSAPAPAVLPSSLSSDALSAAVSRTDIELNQAPQSNSMDFSKVRRHRASSSYTLRTATPLTRESVQNNITQRLIPHYFSESYLKSAKQPCIARQRSSSITARTRHQPGSSRKSRHHHAAESSDSSSTSSLHPIRKASLSRDVKELVASNLPPFQKNPAYELILPQVPLNPPQILHLKNVMKQRHEFIPSSNNFFVHFLGQFSEHINTLKLDYRHIRRYLNLIRVFAALVLEENTHSRGQQSNNCDWNALSILLLQNKNMINLLLDIELCRTNAYSVDAVFRTLDKTEKWICRVGKLSALRSDLLMKAVNASLMTDHFRILSKMLVFLYNTFDELHPHVRQTVMESVLKQWGLQLLCHWHDDVRVCFARLLIYKLLWKPPLPSLSGGSESHNQVHQPGGSSSNSPSLGSPISDAEDRVTVSLKSKAETYLYIVKLYDKIMHSPSTSSKQQLEEKLPQDMKLSSRQRGYVMKTMKDINDIQKEYQKWKQGVFIPYRKRWVEKLKAASGSDGLGADRTLTPSPIPYPIIRIPKFSLRDM
uniref:Uncharacterized protein n=2 Tax=Percolomonas cosmopolitus TaxID=63605 RepID=A0A7S1KL17_9EUKA|mmetsp:Transcript_10330/g.38353  ORF Transcript_10330/g.38353 Transcript_10330/m.38353 type:complete len:1075 (+) Transcript_10330:361-3585(+)|eukprot:CAMPEP_0117446894 /NCGR_PEP_ID=MMETSP0759-20121206/6585_1 /TAXON_ID=63605 /ORGANISM="Percolomonas cosmopolitus, Strain WS" /LENGTH=1074 /DNA_ID=CAMNT_0005239193 /DNA_START=189 /DNA_END=3413 /DNA_ORIENTATION=+